VGRHLDPVSDGSLSGEPGGPDRRRLDDRPQTAPDAWLNPHLRGADVRAAALPRTPGENPLGARPSRAERRREGLLPQSEDPLLRRPADRPTGPPPGGGRRRSDAEPMWADRDSASGGWNAARPPAPRPSLPVSGPMTSAAASTLPPRAPARPVPPRVAPVAGPAARGSEGERSGATAVPLRPSGVSGWPAGAAGPVPPTPDVTQRVSGGAPAESAWGALAAEAPAPRSAPPRAPHTPPRAASARPAPAGAALPARPPLVRPAPAAGRPVQERPVDDRAGTDGTALVATAADETMVASRRAVDVPVGGRAAARLERQAAEAAARKSGGRRSAPPAGPAGGRAPGREDDAPRAPRRAVQGLLAVVVIALVVLGVWSFTSPRTAEIAAQTPVPFAPASAAPLPPPALPSLAPVTTAAPVPPAPVKAPITVLNSTNVTGLAARIGDAFTAGGWEVLGTGAYPGDDIAATTVFYTEGDAEQTRAAIQLVEQFGADVTGPVARFFDVEGVADPGIVVVATGNWRP